MLEEHPKGLAKWEEQKLQFSQNQSVQVQLNPFLHYNGHKVKHNQYHKHKLQRKNRKRKQEKGMKGHHR